MLRRNWLFHAVDERINIPIGLDRRADGSTSRQFADFFLMQQVAWSTAKWPNETKISHPAL
jgi:hypothetical protein